VCVVCESPVQEGRCADGLGAEAAEKEGLETGLYIPIGPGPPIGVEAASTERDAGRLSECMVRDSHGGAQRSAIVSKAGLDVPAPQGRRLCLTGWGIISTLVGNWYSSWTDSRAPASDVTVWNCAIATNRVAGQVPALLYDCWQRLSGWNMVYSTLYSLHRLVPRHIT
jgi:hypothetical protein